MVSGCTAGVGEQANDFRCLSGKFVYKHDNLGKFCPIKYTVRDNLPDLEPTDKLSKTKIKTKNCGLS